MQRPHDWNTVHAFLRAAEHADRAVAAEALDVSPRTVARRIAQLERDTGVTLTVMRGGRLHLTSRGRWLADRVGEPFAALEATMTELRRMASDRTPRVVLSSDVPARWLPPVRRWLDGRGLAAELEVRSPDDVGPLLRTGVADLALVVGADPRLGGVVIAEEPALAALPADHWAASQPAVSADDLRELPIALPPSASDEHRRGVLGALAADADRPTVDAPRLGTTAAGLLRAVRHDRAVAIVFPDAAEVPPGVALRPLVPPHHAPISLVARPGTVPSTLRAHADELRALARAAAGDAPGAGRPA